MKKNLTLPTFFIECLAFSVWIYKNRNDLFVYHQCTFGQDHSNSFRSHCTIRCQFCNLGIFIPIFENVDLTVTSEKFFTLFWCSSTRKKTDSFSTSKETRQLFSAFCTAVSFNWIFFHFSVELVSGIEKIFLKQLIKLKASQ